MSLLLRTLPIRPASCSLFRAATAISAFNAAFLFFEPKRRNPVLPGTRRTFTNSTAAAASGDVVVKPLSSPSLALRWVSRTVLCGELSVDDVGKRVHLYGWVALHRVHVRTLPDEFPEAHSLINDMRLDFGGRYCP